MITHILNTARSSVLDNAARQVADWLHIPYEDVTNKVAVAYICKHFEQGAYSGWDGFVEMLEAGR